MGALDALDRFSGARQFVQVRFAGSGRVYTYHNDFAPVAKGDLVEVDTPREGPKRVRVLTVFAGPAPNFPTKPCRGIEDAEVAIDA